MANLNDIEMAFEFVSSQSYGTNEAYVSLDTGEVYYVSDSLDCELPGDFDESDRYLQIPHKNDLDCGRQLVDEFVVARAPHLAQEVGDTFRHRGAYSRWKSMLQRAGLLDDWYQFETERESAAISRWCSENNLPLETRRADNKTEG